MHERRFSGAYSAFQQQRRLSDGWTAHDYRVELRKDAFLARTIVIPDTYVLDGRFFVTSDPQALANDVQRDGENPLEFRTRRPSLEESLRALLLVEHEQHLNPFTFNMITDATARHALAKELGRRTRDDLAMFLARGSVQGMIALLRDALATAGFAAAADLDVLEAGWSRWIQADRDHVLRIKQWDAGMDLPAAVRDDLVQPDDELTTTMGRSMHQNLLASIQHGHTRRAREMLRLNEERQRTLLSAEEEDLETLRRWYDQNRHRALARQHHCTAYVHGEDLGVGPIGRLRRYVQAIAAGEIPDGEGAVGAPKEFLDTLGNMSPGAFSHLSVACEADLRRWWARGDRDALRRLVDGVMVRSPEWQQASSNFGTLVEFFAGLTTGVGVALATGDALVTAAATPVGVWLVTRAKKCAGGFATGRVVEHLTAHTEGVEER